MSPDTRYRTPRVLMSITDYVLIGLMIENACHICRQESDIHLIAGDHCRQLIGGGYHGKLVGILGLAVFGILHQLYQSHRGGAL